MSVTVTAEIKSVDRVREEVVLAFGPLDVEIMHGFNQKNLGREIKIVISRWYKRRTNPQNNMFHKICSIIAGWPGVEMSMEQVKEGVKWRAMEEHGYPGIENKVSKRQDPKPSAEADLEEMGILFETAFEVAGELEVQAVQIFYRDYLEGKYADSELEQMGRAQADQIPGL
jgi:hypothetical protein